MAKIKFSALVSEMSGKLNGSVIARGKNYTTVRNRVIPVNVQSVAQTQVRQIFATISKNWSSLSESQREAWNQAVPDWVGTGIFADTLTQSGKSLYQKLNNNLLMNGFEGVNLPPMKTNFTAIAINSFEWVPGPAELNFEVNSIDGAPFPTSQNLIIKMTRPLTAGTSNVNNKFVKLRNVDFPGAAIPTIAGDLYDSYTAQFGNLPIPSTIGLECFLINKLTGETSLTVRKVITLEP